MTNIIKEIKVEGHEKVVHVTNEITKLDCIIALHNSKLGPTLGGVRSWSYSDYNAQLKDALLSISPCCILLVQVKNNNNKQVHNTMFFF